MSRRACLGDDANAKVFLELLKEYEGEYRMGNQANPCWDETLQQNLALDYHSYYYYNANQLNNTFILKCNHLSSRPVL